MAGLEKERNQSEDKDDLADAEKQNVKIKQIKEKGVDDETKISSVNSSNNNINNKKRIEKKSSTVREGKTDIPQKPLPLDEPAAVKEKEIDKVEQPAVDSKKQSKQPKAKTAPTTSKQKGSKVVKDTKKTKEISKKKERSVKDQEIPNKKQTTLTQHFQVRRSERKPKTVEKEEVRLSIEKKILNGNEDGLEIRVLEDKGRGIFSTKGLKKGDLVCEYAGDLIDIKEANERENEYSKDPESGCYMYYFEYNNSKYCVDATKESGRLGRLLNHSKTKNNVTTTLFPINNVPHLILVAKRDISQGEELLYDYGDRSRSSLDSHPWLKT